jgi:Prolyl oligopeptidase family
MLSLVRALVAAVATALLLIGRLAAADPLPGQQALEAYFKRQVQRIADRSLADIKTKAEWERERPERRRQFLEMLGLWPLPPRTDLHPQITGKLTTDRFTVEKLLFQSSPGLYVTANLYVPKLTTFPAPTVLYVCGHSPTIVNGVPHGNKVSYQHHAVWFAEHGYVCLVLDTLQLGEIPGVHHGTYRDSMWWWQTLGYTPAGIECWNAMRALDYLETRVEVDRKRIGVTGRSGGGATSWWIAAADDRPQCIVPVAGIADLYAHVVEGVAPEYLHGVISGHCDCMYFVNTYRWDFPEVAALCAPRPLMLGNSTGDAIFPVPGYRRLAEKVRHIYDLYGAGDRFVLWETAGPHKDTLDMRLGAYWWMNRWLKVVDRAPEDAVNGRIHELFIKPAQVPLPAAPAVVREWWPRQRDEWLQALREKAFSGWPEHPVPLSVRNGGETRQGARVTRKYQFTSEESVDLPLFVETVEQARRPERVLLIPVDEKQWQSRQAGQSDESIASGAKSQNVARVMLPPRGIGPTRWAEDGSSADTHIRRRFPLLGQTLDGQRVWDVRRGIAALKEIPELAGAPITVQAEGDMAGIALYAAVFEPEIKQLQLRNLPASHMRGPILLKVRRILDVPQAVALAFSRTVELGVRDAAEAESWRWPLDLQKALGQELLRIRVVSN